MMPIDLEELTERASLQTRIDRKYVIPSDKVDALLHGIEAGARVLEIGGERDFAYESVYFDTPDLASYHLAARGRRRRFKVRRRTYLDSGESFVEVKTRGGRGATVKERTPDLGTGAHLLPASGSAFVSDVLREAGIEHVCGEDLRPTLRTSYRRTTLYLPASDSRVTVDTDVTWSLPGQPGLTLGGVAIFETKSAGGASAADRRLWRHGHRPSRISKYGTGLAALRGDLPSNKWCPVLRHHFACALPAPTSSDWTLS
jgi:VTC domain